MRPFVLPRVQVSASARMVPAPHIGSSTACRGFTSASRTIAAATVGRSDAGTCSSL